MECQCGNKRMMKVAGISIPVPYSLYWCDTCGRLATDDGNTKFFRHEMLRQLEYFPAKSQINKEQ